MRKLILACLIPLAACSAVCPPLPPPPEPVVKVIDTGCSWVKPLTASASDTLETRQEIDAHDRALSANCPAAAPG